LSFAGSVFLEISALLILLHAARPTVDLRILPWAPAEARGDSSLDGAKRRALTKRRSLNGMPAMRHAGAI
jgi:hypothetical protein